MSGSRAPYGQRRLKHEWIANDEIREAVEDAHRTMTYAEICRRLGWITGHKGKSSVGDITRLERRLGMTPEARGGRLSRHIRTDIAAAIIRAIGRDPIDFGL